MVGADTLANPESIKPTQVAVDEVVDKSIPENPVEESTLAPSSDISAAPKTAGPVLPRLAPAPVPQSSPWKQQAASKVASVAEVVSSIVPDARARQAPAKEPVVKRISDKQKWEVYTPAAAPAPPAGQERQQKSKSKSRSGRNPRSGRQNQNNGDQSRKSRPRTENTGNTNTNTNAASNSNASSNSSNGANTNASSAANTNTNPNGLPHTDHSPDHSGHSQSNGSPHNNGNNQKYRPKKERPASPTRPLTDDELSFMFLVTQVEYYVSLDNLCKDMYLRKHMNSKGLIPISVLAEFNRVKLLSQGNGSLVVAACHNAPSVEVIGSKFRPLFEWQRWILPFDQRLPVGKNEDDEEDDDAPEFQVESAEPFIPKSQ